MVGHLNSVRIHVHLLLLRWFHLKMLRQKWVPTAWLLSDATRMIVLWCKLAPFGTRLAEPIHWPMSCSFSSYMWRDATLQARGSFWTLVVPTGLHRKKGDSTSGCFSLWWTLVGLVFQGKPQGSLSRFPRQSLETILHFPWTEMMADQIEFPRFGYGIMVE